MMRHLLLWLCLVIGGTAPTLSEEAAPKLYQAQAVTSGTMPARRALGFALCLREVLVKVSGDPRLASTPRTAAFADRAADFITAFTFRDRLTGVALHDEQGSYDRPHDLTCTFDARKIDGMLAALGSKPWPLPRPRIVVALSVKDMKGRTWMLTDGKEGSREEDMRLSLLALVPRYGLEVRLATPQEIARAKAGGKAAAPDTVQGDVMLTGSLGWSDVALGWVADWSITNGGATARWRVSGVGFDDAFRNGLGGAAQVLSGNGTP